MIGSILGKQKEVSFTNDKENNGMLPFWHTEPFEFSTSLKQMSLLNDTIYLIFS